MHKKAKPFFIKVITPLHVGSGQDLGIVDLPIQRERYTGFPKIEASGLKGSIREIFEEIKKDEEKFDKLKEKYSNIVEKWERIMKKGEKEVKEIVKNEKGEELTKFDQAISLVFGPEKGGEYAGALGFTDARILFFPVKSAKGVFAWTTCPEVLKRFKRDMALAGETVNLDLSKMNLDDGKCLVTDDSALVINDAVVLEEYAFNVSDKNDGGNWGEVISKLLNPVKIDNSRLLILSDNDFKGFVSLSTEIITRTRIDNETGTVKSGALFTEEYLPSETVMYFLALANPIFNKDKGIFDKKDKPEEEQVLEFLSGNISEVMQIGGNATIGKGLVEITFLKEAKNEDNK